MRRLRAVSATSSSERRRREIGDDGVGPIWQRARHAGEERASERWPSGAGSRPRAEVHGWLGLHAGVHVFFLQKLSEAQ